MSVPPGNAGLFARRKEYWYASNGDTVMIPCLAKDWSPFANISWHFRNEVGIERIIEEHASSMGNLTGQGAWRNPQADPTKPELLLVIPKFQHDQHSGYYACRVENDVGSLQREILLAPRGEFQVISQSVGDWKLFWSIPHRTFGHSQDLSPQMHPATSFLDLRLGLFLPINGPPPCTICIIILGCAAMRMCVCVYLCGLFVAFRPPAVSCNHLSISQSGEAQQGPLNFADHPCDLSPGPQESKACVYGHKRTTSPAARVEATLARRFVAIPSDQLVVWCVGSVAFRTGKALHDDPVCCPSTTPGLSVCEKVQWSARQVPFCRQEPVWPYVAERPAPSTCL